MTTGNWGRWGEEDERGAANLIDPAAVLRAAATVRRGQVYPLGIPVRESAPTVGGRRPPQHFMRVDGADYIALDRDHGYADDYVLLATHGTSHVDALSHLWHEGSMYNGFSMNTVRSSGASRCAIDKLGHVVTRAHLVSFSEHPGDIEATELEQALSGSDVASGDALLVHTGWMDRWSEHPADEVVAPALAPSAAEWIAERDIAIVGADNPAVERYGEDRLHTRLLRDCGIYLMELLSLVGPVADRVREGLLVVAPLLISRGVGSPVNPILVV